MATTQGKYFITGATGFIGANLCKRLVAEGHIVHALCRSEKKAALFLNKNVKIIKGDIHAEESLRSGMEGCDYVFHLAAFAKVWSKDPMLFYKVNVEGTINVLNAARVAGVKKTVITSTAGVFGPSFGTPVNEDTVRQIDFFNEYEETKWQAEQEVLKFIKEGMRICMVYPTRVYGPGQMSESNAVTKLIDSYCKGKWRMNLGDGTSIGNYVFIDDILNGHLLAMDHGKQGEQYILAGENASYNKFFDELAKVSGKRLYLFKIPLYLLWFFAWIQLMLAKVFGRPPLITPKWVRKYHYNTEVSSEKAVRELGYEITSLQKGIQKTIEWINQK